LIPLKLSLTGRSGYARLFLPLSMAETMAEGVTAEPEVVAEPTASDLSKLTRLGFLKTSLWSELGRVPLQVAEINALEVGDVVVLENTGAHVQSGRLAGHLSLRVGDGEHGGFFAEIVPDHASLKVKILRADLEQL
jgi:flagellar motor switch protein FliM